MGFSVREHAAKEVGLISACEGQGTAANPAPVLSKSAEYSKVAVEHTPWGAASAGHRADVIVHLQQAIPGFASILI